MFCLAWTPSQEWQKEHFRQEPFDCPAVWPESLQFVDLSGADGARIRTIMAGPTPGASKGVMIFVHGFPENSKGWKDYLLYYAAAGYHVLAPDMRNVNASMTSSTHMTLDLLADDLQALVKSTGQKAIVVGHDWGAAAAWCFVLKHPEHVQAFVALAVPHMELYRSYNATHLPFSLKHVWYFLFFGLGGPLARWKVAQNDFSWFIWFVFGSSDPKTFSMGEIKELKEIYKRTLTTTPSTLTSWYLMGCLWFLKSFLPASVQAQGLMSSFWTSGRSPSTVPTLQLFGGRDIYVAPGMYGFASLPQYVSNPLQRTVIFDATHWLNHEKKAEIMEEIDGFLGKVGKALRPSGY